jgi:hypothetical protein
MTMFDVVPTSPACGLPLRRPLVESKVAQPGLFCTLYVSVPAAPATVGWNEYASPTFTLLAGVPEMLSAAAVTFSCVAGPAHPAIAPLTINPSSATLASARIETSFMRVNSRVTGHAHLNPTYVSRQYVSNARHSAARDVKSITMARRIRISISNRAQ